VHGDVPLVFLGSLDPLALGVVDSLAKRTEAITGITAMGYDLSSKRLQILKDIVPALSRVALVVNPKTRAPTENGNTVRQQNCLTCRFALSMSTIMPGSLQHLPR
jgi:ABC-type uncharacterized transport system substrate-binding protein